MTVGFLWASQIMKNTLRTSHKSEKAAISYNRSIFIHKWAAMHKNLDISGIINEMQNKYTIPFPPDPTCFLK